MNELFVLEIKSESQPCADLALRGFSRDVHASPNNTRVIPAKPALSKSSKWTFHLDIFFLSSFQIRHPNVSKKYGIRVFDFQQQAS